jgi:hypothetical protein
MLGQNWAMTRPAQRYLIPVKFSPKISQFSLIQCTGPPMIFGLDPPLLTIDKMNNCFYMPNQIIIMDTVSKVSKDNNIE